MKNIRTLVISALAALTSLGGLSARADNMASIAITPATGAVTLVPRWALGGSLAGFHEMAQDLSLGGGANQFYSIKSTAIPAGGDVAAFSRYIAGSGAATAHADIGSKLTPTSYSALSSADPDVGYGSINFYLIHHKSTGDYFTVIKPSSATASAVTDLKPMSGPGGPATLGASGYFGLTFAAANLGYGLNYFYYLRTDSVTGFTVFGTLDPALLGTGADKFNLGTGGHNALIFTGTDVGYGNNKMYFERLDPVTGFTILGTLNPLTGKPSDIANLGSVFSTLDFVPGDVGFGAGQFYTTGAINTNWQSVSFAAIADRLVSAGSFTVNPSASSALAIALTVVSGSTGSATISGPVAGVFTVTPTAPGLITLQATQAGNGLVEFNMLRQSFTVTGVATSAPVVTNSPLTAGGTVGTSFTFTITATQSPTSFSVTTLPAGLTLNPSTGVITGAPTTIGTTNVTLGATNSFGTGNATLAITVAAAGAAPVISNNPLTAAGTVGSTFSFTITATGSPTGYTASPLPAGLNINLSTGAITGTPTATGTTIVQLGATNGSGTGNAALTITVAASGVAPIITNNPLTAAGTIGSPFSFTVTASGAPTSYTAVTLPAGLSLVASTGVITGSPTASGTTIVQLGATNAAGTGNAALTITIAAATVAPVITSPGTAPGTVGTPFVTYLIAATGLPTSYAAFNLPPGLVLNTLTGAITGTPTASGTTFVTLTATNSAGSTNATLMIVIAGAAVAPIITSPTTATATAGSPFPTYIIGATGLPTSYTATGLPPGLTLDPLTGAINGTPTTPGTYTVTITATNSSGTSTATLTITVGAGPSSRIVNFSARALSGPGDQTLIMGFVVSGNGKHLLVRGIGPSLAAFGVVNFLADPMLTLYGPSGALAANDNWGTNSAGQAQGTLVAATAVQVGAFALPVGSLDSGLLFMVDNGAHTTGLLRPNSTTGVALTEIYDTDLTPGSRLINVSARMNVSAGEGTLIAGLVISGNAPKTVLIRGVGPTLSAFGVGGVLPDPTIAVYSNTGVQVVTDDNWETGPTAAATIVAISAQVGAFPLATGSKDAALLLTLQPGSYTVQVSGVGTPSGVALIEVYDTQ